MKIHPFLYKVGCASCGAITILPINIIHTKIITNNKVVFKPKELLYIILMCNIFAIQNIIFHNINYIKNNGIKGACTAIYISPLIIYLKIKKFKCRFNLDPKYKIFIITTIIKEIVFYTSLYSFYNLNFKIMKIIAPILSNIISYPFKFIILKYSYPMLDIKFKIMKKTLKFEIFESSLGDMIGFYLMYK